MNIDPFNSCYQSLTQDLYNSHRCSYRCFICIRVFKYSFLTLSNLITVVSEYPALTLNILHGSFPIYITPNFFLSSYIDSDIAFISLSLTRMQHTKSQFCLIF